MNFTRWRDNQRGNNQAAAEYHHPDCRAYHRARGALMLSVVKVGVHISFQFVWVSISFAISTILSQTGLNVPSGISAYSSVISGRTMKSNTLVLAPAEVPKISRYLSSH